jgi:hypothetical protein
VLELQNDLQTNPVSSINELLEIARRPEPGIGCEEELTRVALDNHGVELMLSQFL